MQRLPNLTRSERDLPVGQAFPQLQRTLRVHQQGHHMHKLQGEEGRRGRETRAFTPLICYSK